MATHKHTPLSTSLHSYCNRRILKFSVTGQLLDTWQDPIANVPLFVPHKLTLNAAQDKLYLADRENSRVVVYGTKSGHGEVFSSKTTLGGKPFAIFANGSSDWPMHGVFGGKKGVMGFSLDRGGKVINTWGPQGVSLCGNGRHSYNRLTGVRLVMVVIRFIAHLCRDLNSLMT